MRDVAEALPPKTIIDAYEKSFVDNTSHVQALWTAVGKETGEVMALGVRTLAMLWDAAWKAGGGNKNAGPVKKDDLRALYEDTNFLRSMTVNGIEHEIAHPSALGAGAAIVKKKGGGKKKGIKKKPK
jgi:hypothetical protein